MAGLALDEDLVEGLPVRAIEGAEGQAEAEPAEVLDELLAGQAAGVGEQAPGAEDAVFQMGPAVLEHD